MPSSDTRIVFVPISHPMIYYTPVLITQEKQVRTASTDSPAGSGVKERKPNYGQFASKLRYSQLETNMKISGRPVPIHPDELRRKIGELLTPRRL